ncbi:MAG: NAD(P)H-binding protein [Brucellaceae bacterium]|nr:NAD(P)H-binding protein [Brucellaceae bacterium]
MKVILFGAAGRIGAVIADELAARGHAVTAVYRTESHPADLPPNVKPITGDAQSAEAVAAAVAGHDAVISAVGPGTGQDPGVIERVAGALVGGLAKANVSRLIVVGGAGTLEVRPGVMRLDTPEFPEQYRASGIAQKAALEIYRASGLDWTYVSPPVLIQPGERRGTYRIGGNAVLYDENGRSHISRADYACALADILEAGSNKRSRITVAY